MADYLGWDRNWMLQAGTSLDLGPQTTASSFTPINQHRTLPRTITPQRTLLNHGLDSDSLYTLEEEDAPEEPPVKSKKRPIAAKGRAVSFTSVWQYEDEGDLAQYNNGPDFVEAVPAKRKRTASKTASTNKAAPKKRAQSMKVPVMTLEKAWENVEETGTGLAAMEGTQLTTPPDSGKRAKGRAGSLATTRRSNLNKPFQNPAITKPTSVREEGTKDALPTPVTSYQGFTTSEDKLKTAATTLSQTTLAKLAMFRFRPSTDSTESRTPAAPSNVVEAQDEINLLPIQQASEHPSSSYGTVPSSDSFFKQATWHSGGSNYHNRSEHIDHEPNTNSMVANEDQPSYESTSQQYAAAYGSHDPVEIADQALGAFSQPPGSTAMLNNERQISRSTGHTGDQDYYPDPTSSEGILLHGLLNEVSGDSHRARVKVLDTLSDRPLNVKIRDSCDNAGVLEDKYNRHRVGAILESEKNHVGLDERSMSDDLPSKHQPVDETTVMSHGMTGAYAGCEIEVERSDVDDYERDPYASNDYYENDEFDEGLDDEDLLTISPELIIPQTQAPTLLVRSQSFGAPLLNQSFQSHASAGQEINVSEGRSDVVNLPIPANPSSLNIEVHKESSEHSDEFSIDREDEEELLQLLEPHLDVKETFIPPRSVQEAYDADDYDGLPPFSPPSSPSKAPENHTTDKSSPNQAPRQESVTSLMEEEEDWSFMNANGDIGQQEVPMVAAFAIPKAVVRPQPARSGPTTPAISSPLKRCTSAFSKADTSTTQLTVDWSLIDDSHEYEPLLPFVRPEFPPLITDRCPVIGLSPQTFLRTCFRIGEMFQAGGRSHALGQDAVIELFARVNFSSRESGTTKQHFQFLDLWHDRPPYPNGVLPSFKTSGLAESESKVFLVATGDEKKMARVLGRLKRDNKKGAPWLLNIINIRETDWEEIRWTRRIVSGDDLVKKDKELREAVIAK